MACSTQIRPLCWHQAVAHLAQARPLCWRKAVARSFSPGQAGCSATEKSRWPHKLRLCRLLAQCSQVALSFQCWLLPWSRACGSWGTWQVALQTSCNSARLRRVQVALWAQQGRSSCHAGPTALTFQGRLLCCPIDCAFAPGTCRKQPRKICGKLCGCL